VLRELVEVMVANRVAGDRDLEAVPAVVAVDHVGDRGTSPVS
jgi:hypothetical protein